VRTLIMIAVNIIYYARGMETADVHLSPPHNRGSDWLRTRRDAALAVDWEGDSFQARQLCGIRM